MNMLLLAIAAAILALIYGVIQTQRLMNVFLTKEPFGANLALSIWA